MIFEIDVSGEDIFTKDYTIVIADKNNFIRGFKFNGELIQDLVLNYSGNKYRYKESKHGKVLLKIRVYCIIIYYLFENLGIRNKEITLEICRDFHGHEREITSQLKFFLENKLGLKINCIYVRLPKGSNADKYAYLMRKDTKNQIKGYAKITLDDIERYLKRK